MPLLTFFIYHRFTSHITVSGTAAVNILMSFIALLFALLVQYVNDHFELSIVNCELSIDLVENNGFEPLTPCVQGRCSSQLS